MESGTRDTKLMKSSNEGTLVGRIAKAHMMVVIIVMAHVRCVVVYSADVSNAKCVLAIFHIKI